MLLSSLLALFLTTTPDRPAVVVELFTSEGCSSCPRADRLLAKLDREQPNDIEIIALEIHVDYWNHLGWADPFSSRAFSERQEDYARWLGKGVFTPQAVVNGEVSVLGSDEARLRRAIIDAAKDPRATVAIRALPSDRVHISAKAKEGASVFIAITERSLATDVPRGENAGERVEHGPIVRTLTRLGKIGKEPFQVEHALKLEPGWKRDRLRAVVFVADGPHGISGAAATAIPRSL